MYTDYCTEKHIVKVTFNIKHFVSICSCLCSSVIYFPIIWRIIIVHKCLLWINTINKNNWCWTYVFIINLHCQTSKTDFFLYFETKAELLAGLPNRRPKYINSTYNPYSYLEKIKQTAVVLCLYNSYRNFN